MSEETVNAIVKELLQENVDNESLAPKQVLEIAEKLDLGITVGLMKKVLKRLSFHKCITCNSYYDNKKELKAHLRKKHHYIKPKVLKQRKEKLLERVYPGVSDKSPDFFARHAHLYPLKFELLKTRALKLTFIEFAITRAYMIFLKNKNIK